MKITNKCNNKETKESIENKIEKLTLRILKKIIVINGLDDKKDLKSNEIQTRKI